MSNKGYAFAYFRWKSSKFWATDERRQAGRVAEFLDFYELQKSKQ